METDFSTIMIFIYFSQSAQWALLIILQDYRYCLPFYCNQAATQLHTKLSNPTLSTHTQNKVKWNPKYHAFAGDTDHQVTSRTHLAKNNHFSRGLHPTRKQTVFWAKCRLQTLNDHHRSNFKPQSCLQTCYWLQTILHRLTNWTWYYIRARAVQTLCTYQNFN